MNGIRLPFLTYLSGIAVYHNTRNNRIFYDKTFYFDT